MMVTWNRDLREESTGVFLATDGRRIPKEQLLKTVFVMVKWSNGQMVKWSNGQMVRWSNGQTNANNPTIKD